jgi:arylsulfatase A-like enzyme
VSRSPHLRALLVAFASLAVALGGLDAVPRAARAGAGTPPNVLIILTDDQRPTDTMHVMPETLQRFGAEGVAYPNAVATTPLCCPGRAGIMTGQFAHNNGVRTNGDVEALGNHASTLQRYLDDAGYQTGLVGKFLNQWEIEDNPPHWDRWSMLQPGPDYFSSEWNIQGVTQTINEYSTDFAAERAVSYVDEFNAPVNDDQPWFLYVAPYAPHAPYQPAPEYANADVGVWPGNPAVFEKDKSDKPPAVQRRKRNLADAQPIRDNQLRMLMSVDDMVEDVFDRLQVEGELDNTIAFFLSDNGFLWSDHGLGGKNEPYLPSARIPFFVRWPGQLTGGTVDPRLAANIDVAPTALDAIGQPVPSSMDGQSLLRAQSRTKILVEGWNRQHLGGWASMLTPRYQYIEWYADDNVTVQFRELYDITKDPYQLKNVLGDGKKSNDSDRRGLARELRAARTCGPGAASGSCRSQLAETVALCSGSEYRRADHIVGTLRRDRLNDRGGRGLLCGFAGRDRLRGGGGNDLLLGGPGRDRMVGGQGKDACKGGPSPDRTKGCERGR